MMIIMTSLMRCVKKKRICKTSSSNEPLYSCC